MRRRRLLLGLVLVGVASVAAYFAWPRSPIKIERDRSSRFRIDPAQPYQISFGETYLPSGGGIRTTLSHDGQVAISRSTDQRIPGTRSPLWEETTFTVPPEVLAKVLNSVDSTGVMGLHASYENTNTFDGTQLYLSITQGERAKSVWCRQHFPTELTAFKSQLTTLLGEPSKNATWKPSKER